LKPTLDQIVAAFGHAAKAKLSSASAQGEPEDQLRAPFEQLLLDMAALTGLPRDKVVPVGETRLAEQHIRPDYAVTVHGALTGYVEIKAPGKGADPRRFKGEHDKAQWKRLQSLPNLLYTDGNEFSLWRNGERIGELVRLDGDIEAAGGALRPGPGLEALFDAFLGWQPVPPRSARELAEVSARLCRLLRDEVVEALERGTEALTTLADDWRNLLFPQADQKQFADGYAQAVTFGLLMARARGITIGGDLHKVAEGLADSASLIGAALQLLTDNKATRQALATSLGTLERVLDVVDWPTLSKGRGDAWLYFYEDFLETYDNTLRKQTGSYYTPPEVVGAMVALVDEALRRPGFGIARGLADDAVTVCDPATGTGTYVLGVLRHLARRVAEEEGEGAVPASVASVLQRLVAFELQLGPFAVAQLRVLAEVMALTGAMPKVAPRMFVTDTLGNPNDDGGKFPGYTAAIGVQRKAANRIKREQPITVVIGNPPYKDKAKGLGGWVEGEGRNKGEYAPLDDWQPPPELGVHAKHLRNLYVYFWRWASRKVFEPLPGQAAGGGRGVVAFITAAGFLSGPGFVRMRQRLRQSCHEIWVIDCSPEGLQPEAATRIFQGVQQPVCIVIGVRQRDEAKTEPAQVRWRALPAGHRDAKFEALSGALLSDPHWQDCPSDEGAPFLPAAAGAWTSYPRLDSLFSRDGSGVQPMRVWVIAPDAESLARRWQALVSAPAEDKQRLFHPTLRAGVPADRHIESRLKAQLPGHSNSLLPLASEQGACAAPVRYAMRSFDRQWLIPDIRVITNPKLPLWESASQSQVFFTAQEDRSPGTGPAATFCAALPDMHHFGGRSGRVFQLWLDRDASLSNFKPRLLTAIGSLLRRQVSPEDLFAYIACLASHPGFVARFRSDLSTPGLRIPITADPALFTEAVALGRQVIWLHTFGERFAEATEGRESGPPRLPPERRPRVPKDGAIPTDADGMPDSIGYDAGQQRLLVGRGFIEPVPPAVWHYEVSGKQVLVQWFSYRRKNRERPMIGDRRPPSPLGDIQPDTWLAEYTTELLNVLNVLGLLVELEPAQADLLRRICEGRTIPASALPLGPAAGHHRAGDEAAEQPQAGLDFGEA
jgi:hypothetical protein